jgi:6-pyruvoyltetrahydropterin/6-carboxytetrahydropterin synthase
MYEVAVISDFSAAHRLRGYKGKCENLHGHNWKVEVSLGVGKPDKLGMAVDFKEIKKALNSVLETLDHKDLNSVAYFKDTNPTSENIAKYIHDQIKSLKLIAYSLQLKVTVWESDTARATYYEK